jgi:hypothetical protein
MERPSVRRVLAPVGGLRRGLAAALDRAGPEERQAEDRKRGHMIDRAGPEERQAEDRKRGHMIDRAGPEERQAEDRKRGEMIDVLPWAR